MPDLTHRELIQRAERWLRNTKRCGVVLTEAGGGWYEIPDAIGWNHQGSILIECKTSRADFHRDQKKSFRRVPEYGVGQWRYYMARPFLVELCDVPDGWGLLEVREKQIRVKKKPWFITAESSLQREITLLRFALEQYQALPDELRQEAMKLCSE